MQCGRNANASWGRGGDLGQSHIKMKRVLGWGAQSEPKPGVILISHYELSGSEYGSSML